MSNLKDIVQQICLRKRQRYAPSPDDVVVACKGGGLVLLQNLTVLVCEDEPLIAFDVQCELADAGATTLLATTVERGLFIVKTQRIDAAVLDLQLGAEDGTPIATQLEDRKVPFLIHSGFVSRTSDPRTIPKPAAVGELVMRLAVLLGRQAS
jgi:DNA-binding response OmpR family regulator